MEVNAFVRMCPVLWIKCVNGRMDKVTFLVLLITRIISVMLSPTIAGCQVPIFSYFFLFFWTFLFFSYFSEKFLFFPIFLDFERF